MDLITLENSVKKCEACSLHKNGHALVYWTEHSKYIMLMEQPLREEPDYMIKFWELFKEVGLSKQEFVILHTVQCRTDLSKRKKHPTTIPSFKHRSECRQWFNSYVDFLEPPKMLVMGNVAMEHVCGDFDGIKEKNATVTKPKICGMIIPCVLSVSPNFLKKRGEGVKMLKKSLEVFKNL